MEFPVLPLANVPFPGLKLVQGTWRVRSGQDHSRWVFRGPALDGSAEVWYYKIWNPYYVRRDGLLYGLQTGFYDASTTPALRAIFLHHGMCRGFAMTACTPSRSPGLPFYQTILEKTASTRSFAVQFSRAHIMLCPAAGGGEANNGAAASANYGAANPGAANHGGASTRSPVAHSPLDAHHRPTLVDLEGLYPLAALPHLSSQYTVFDDPGYEAFVIALYRRYFPGCPPPQPTALQRTDPPLARPLYLGAAKLQRWLRLRWKTMRSHPERIER